MSEVEEFAQEILEKCIKQKIHDLYFLPINAGYIVKVRKANLISQKLTLTIDLAEKLIMHFKFNGGMNVGEKRRAQLGAMDFEINGFKHRLRLSTAGNYANNESLVIRFLYCSGEDQLNFLDLKEFNKAQQVSKMAGLHLFCGSVGSGKTTLMYELCQERKKSEQVIAIEDPVELIDEQILQFQINEDIGMDYDALIKLCLRHRPDIMIVGEIRDLKTARATIRAALTGHTVFSTLHAGSVAGVLKRLFNLGVSKSDLSESLQAIYFQKMLTNQNNEPAVALQVKTREEENESKKNLENDFHKK